MVSLTTLSSQPIFYLLTKEERRRVGDVHGIRGKGGYLHSPEAYLWETVDTVLSHTLQVGALG